MIKNSPGVWRVFAFVIATGEPVEDAAATITATLKKDDGAEAATTNANPVQSTGKGGYYDFVITAAENNCNQNFLNPASATPGVKVVPLPTAYEPRVVIGGAGNRKTNVSVVDDASQVVPNAPVTLQTSAGLSIAGLYGATSSLGVEVFNLDDGAYKGLVGAMPGYLNHVAQDFTVDEDNEAVTLTVTRITVSDPGSPSLCTVAIDLFHNAAAVARAKVTATLVEGNNTIDNAVMAKSITTDYTDANGHAELQLVRAAVFVGASTGLYRIKVTGPDGTVHYDAQVLIPDVGAVNLQDIAQVA